MKIEKNRAYDSVPSSPSWSPVTNFPLLDRTSYLSDPISYVSGAKFTDFAAVMGDDPFGSCPQNRPPKHHQAERVWTMGPASSTAIPRLEAS